MTDGDDARDREIAELRERLARLEGERRAPPSPPPPPPNPYAHLPSYQAGQRAASGGRGFSANTAWVIIGVTLGLSGLVAIGALTGGAEPPATTSTSTSAEAFTATQRQIAQELEQSSATSRTLSGGAASAPAPNPSSWTYSTAGSPMDSRPTRIACTPSTNQVYLTFPYGETGADLCIRSSPQYGHDVYVRLHGRGQILCRSYESCRVRVRYGDRPARAASAIGPEDGSTDMVFLQGAQGVTRELQRADRFSVELSFYQNGNQALVFNTAGLQWPPPGSASASGRAG